MLLLESRLIHKKTIKPIWCYEKVMKNYGTYLKYEEMKNIVPTYIRAYINAHIYQLFNWAKKTSEKIRNNIC